MLAVFTSTCLDISGRRMSVAGVHKYRDSEFCMVCVIFLGHRYGFFFCHPSGAYNFEVAVWGLENIFFWRVIFMHYVTVTRNWPGPSVRTVPYSDVGSHRIWKLFSLLRE